MSFIPPSPAPKKEAPTEASQSSSSSGQPGVGGAGALAGNAAVDAVLKDPENPGAHETAALADPEGYLRQVAHSSWDEVRRNYRQKKLQFADGYDFRDSDTLPGGAKGMNALLWFRLRETLHRKTSSVMVQVAPTVRKEQERRATERSARLGGKAPPIQDLDWNYGAGSGTATSDIDSNLQGDATEFAVKEFNRAFRARWGGRESGHVFDVNVYARDYLPGGSLAKVRQSADEQAQKTGQKLGALIPGSADWASRGVSFETASLKRSQAGFKKAMNDQEAYALMKTRRDMSPFEWIRYKTDVLGSLKEGAARDAKLAVFQRAEQIYEAREDELRNRVAALEQTALEHEAQSKGGAHGTTVGKGGEKDAAGHGSARRLEAENRLYEEKLERVGALREQLLVAKTELASADPSAKEELLARIEKLSVDLTEALHVSSMYANEAYVTRATVLHVVGNQQLLKAASSKNAPNVEVALEVEDYVASANEQLGFIFDDFTREGGNVLKGLLKAGKYIMRLGHAGTKIEKAVALQAARNDEAAVRLPILTAPPTTRQVWTYGERLMEIKDKTAVDKQLEEARDAVGEGGWQPANLKKIENPKAGGQWPDLLAGVKSLIGNFAARLQGLASRMD